MSSYNRNTKRVKESNPGMSNAGSNNIGTSLSALNDAWSSITATKKELRNVGQRIRESTTSPVHFQNHGDSIGHNLPPPPRKDKVNQNIERRVVYEVPHQINFRKENIPPPSYPQPNLNYLQFSTEGHKNVQTYVAKESTLERKRNTSLSGRALLSKEKKSDALKRLKDKINQQKLNSSSSINEENVFPEKTYHAEDDVLFVNKDDEFPHQMTRKIAHAPSAPTYTGFNLQPDATFVKLTSISPPRKTKKKKNDNGTVLRTTKNKCKISPKVTRKSGKAGKNQRIIAPKKPASSIITTSSWRVGQEIQRKAKKEIKKKQQNNKPEKPSSELKSEATVTLLHSEATENVGEDHLTPKSDDNSVSSKSKDTLEEIDMKVDDISDKSKPPLELSDDDGDDEFTALKDNAVLPKAAKDILEELQIDSEISVPGKRRAVKAVVDTGLTRKQKSPSVKRKLDDVIASSKKERHYDQSEVKKYMMKQQAERKRRRVEQQKKQKKERKEKESKLQELFKKQKKAVKESAVHRKRHDLGHTFTRQAWKPNKEFEFKDRKFSDDMTDSLEFTSRMKTFPSHLRKDFGVDPPTTTTSSSFPVESDTESDEDIHFTVDEKSDDVIEIPPQPSKTDTEAVKADRVAAIRETAAALRERLMVESKRLTDLVECRQKKRTTTLPPSNNGGQTVEMKLDRIQHSPTNYPGVHNLDSQAELNERLTRMESAAKKIQAVYRGYNVRQNLRSWQLPSGRTLYQTLEEARRRAFLMDIDNARPVQLASSNYEPVRLASIPTRSKSPDQREQVEEGEDDSMASLISDALMSSKMMLKDAERSLSSVSKRKSTASKVTTDHFPSYSNTTNTSTTTGAFEVEGCGRSQTPPPTEVEEDDHKERLRRVLEKYKDEPSDKYSVINIFARNYPGLTQQQFSDNRDKQRTQHAVELTPNGTETEELLADAHANALDDPDTFIDDFLSEQTLSEDETERTLSPKSPQPMNSAGSSESLKKLVGELSKSPTHSRASYRSSLLSPKSHLLLIPSDESDGSEKLFSPRSPSPSKHQVGNRTQSPPSTRVRPEINASFSTDDSRQSGSLFSEREHEEPLDPVLTSTKRSPKADVDKKSGGVVGGETPLTGNVNYGRGVDSRMSPNSLERRLRAELNLFDSVGDSLQQINEMDRIRDIVQAQQETVSLAQVLKNRQVQHQKDLDRMSIEAREKTAQSAQEIERAKRTAAEAETNAQKVISEVKNKAAENVADSARQFSKNQNEATALSLEAIRESERVRRDAFETYKQSIDDRLSNVGDMMTAAASAASTAAVEAALKQHREKLEALRVESLNKVSKSYTATFTDETSSFRHTSYSLTSRSDSTLTQDDIADRKTEETATYKSAAPVSEDIADETPKSRASSNGSRTNSAKSPSTLYSETSRTASTSKTSTLKASAHLTEAISEDLLPSPVKTEDRELTEALFSTEKKEDSKNDESIRSNYSDEKFHSSFTEDELKHDFRQVLPSENHRRKSLDHHRDFLVSGNETSSDEVAVPKSSETWSKKRSRSPFVDEDTFTRFTSEMVRQYVQEEEVRSKHQAALLGLREKALVEKTKAELAYLEMQRKTLKKKGADERMPPITKKQRALMLRLESEQAEIRRIKDAFKAASNERKFMLKQEQDIQRIRKTTKKIWNEVGNYKSSNVSDHTAKEESDGGELTKSVVSSSVVTAEDEDSIHSEIIEKVPSADISEDLPSAASKSPRTISEVTSSKRTSTHVAVTTSKSENTKVMVTEEDDEVSATEEMLEASQDEPSTLSKDLKKLKYMAGKKYLTEREMKLQTKKHQFSEIMNRKTKLKTWRQKIIEEEMKLKADIRKVLDHGIMKTDETSGRDESGEDSVSNDFSPSLRRSKRSPASVSSTSKALSESILPSPVGVPDRSASSSIAEDFEAEAGVVEGETTITEAINVSSTKRSVTESIKRPATTESYNYSNDFEESNSKVSRPSTRTNSQQRENRRNEEDSWTEGTSDASDTEQRLKALEVELRKRRAELQKLRKKNEKEKLRQKEQDLRRELQAVEQQINKENVAVDLNIIKVSTPRVLSPRGSLDSIILPEKIKIPSEKESRRSLDFENDSDRTISSKSSSKSSASLSKSDISHSPKVSSIRSTRKLTDKDSSSPVSSFRDAPLVSPRKEKDLSEKSPASSLRSNEKISENEISERLSSSLKSNERTSEKDISERLPASLRSNEKISDKDISERLTASLRSSEKLLDKEVSSRRVTPVDKHSDSVDELSDISLGRDQSDTSIDESIKRTVASITEDGISTTITTRPASKKSSVDEIYDDDFFESDSSASKRSSKTVDRSSSSGNTTSSSTRTLKDRSVDDEDISVRSTSKKDAGGSIAKSERGRISEDVTTNQFEYSEKFDSGSVAIKSHSSSSSISIAEDISERITADISEKSVSVKSEKSTTPREHEIVEKSTSRKSEIAEEDRTKTPDEVSIVSDKASIHSTSLSTKSYVSSLTSSKTSSVSSTTTSAPPTTPRDDFSKSNISSALGFRVEDRVRVEGSLMGTIRYLGKTSFSPVLVAGIELDEAMGTNDGTFHDKQYFKCAPDHGFFTTIERLQHFNESAESKKLSDKKTDIHDDDDNKSSSSTIEEIDESLDLNSFKDDFNEHELSENLEQFSESNKSKQDKEQIGLLEADLLPDAKSSSSTLSHTTEKSVPLEAEARVSEEVSDDESIEIPSPTKLDIQPLADKITDSILQSIITDSIKVFTLPAATSSRPQRSAEIVEIGKPKSPRDSISPLNTNETISNVTRTLLNDAVSVMMKVGETKERKLSSVAADTKKENFLSLIVPDELEDDNDDFDMEINENESLLSAKINQLKSVHDQLGSLLGDDDDDDDDIIESVSKEQSQDISVKEEPIQIPYNERDTQEIVTLALQEINREDYTLPELERLIVPDSILALPTNSDVDEPSTMLYKTLVFDLTVQLYFESKEFRDFQRESRAPWLKRPRKTFSKFTRRAHLNETEDFTDMVVRHVCACVGLRAGRPSLVQLKRKLPLNLEKKDYVDAILVDELRQEEAQWINYDEDELKVKYQLADTILESLLEETVDIINKALT